MIQLVSFASEDSSTCFAFSRFHQSPTNISSTCVRLVTRPHTCITKHNNARQPILAPCTVGQLKTRTSPRHLTTTAEQNRESDASASSSSATRCTRLTGGPVCPYAVLPCCRPPARAWLPSQKALCSRGARDGACCLHLAFLRHNSENVASRAPWKPTDGMLASRFSQHT